jgi:glycosyltransferase involved in cell wall biosynthesis
MSCLKILKDLIKAQSYKHILEWVIVDGNSTEEDARLFEEGIDELREDIKVVYAPFEKDKNQIGYLRNKGNRYASGDILVCMDDDDFYFCDRVEHAVNELVLSSKKVAGCSEVILYDYFLNKLYKFSSFGPNHSTNACLAYKKEYQGVYDDTKVCSEEPSFLKNFTTPMIQLDSYKVMVVNSHNYNTFNKRELLVAGTLGLNPKCKELDMEVTQFIPNDIFQSYREIFVKSEKSKYDIVFYMGGFYLKFDPRDDHIEGMAQSVVSISAELTKYGKKIAVYGMVDKSMTYKGVDYYDWKEFPFQDEFKTIVLWRNNGLVSFAPFQYRAESVVLDLHDGVLNDDFKKWFNPDKFTKIFVKSNYHKSAIQNQ